MLTIKSESEEDLSKKDDIKQLIEENNIKFVQLHFTDIFGFSKKMEITLDELDTALDGKLMFDGSSIDGFGSIESSDMYLVPDLDTFKPISFKSDEEGIGHIFCDVYGPDKKPFAGCPRNILKKALAKAQSMGYDLNVGPEGEFFLFNLDDSGKPIFDIHDNGGYFDAAPSDKGDNARRDIILKLEELGFHIEASHHEVASGQHEINFKFGNALQTADKWIIFKQIVKNTAEKHGLYASFIPKPFSNDNGNAMHCNQSLSKNGENIFYDKNTETGLSKIAKYYIGGLIKHSKAISAVCNPTINSYKRLVPNYEAPTNIAWSRSNRSAFIRIPHTRGSGTRIELRTPDPTANPYLVYAVMLYAGLDGIENKITPPKEATQNIYKMSETEKELHQIEEYPHSLEKALEHMQDDPLIKEALGQHAYQIFLTAKKNELRDFQTEVHKWEIENYLNKY